MSYIIDREVVHAASMACAEFMDIADFVTCLAPLPRPHPLRRPRRKVEGADRKFEDPLCFAELWTATHQTPLSLSHAHAICYRALDLG